MSRSDNGKLKIAMLGHKRMPSREGGVEIVVEELSVRMAERGHSVVVYNRGGHHVGGKEYDKKPTKFYKGVRLKKVLTVRGKGISAMTSSFFAALKAAFSGADIVHFHAEGSCAMLWLPKLFRKKCIVTVHGLDWQREKWQSGLGSKYIKHGEKCAVRLADEIIVLSKNVEQYFLTRYGRKTVYIPNGVNRPETVPAELITEKYGLERDSYYLFLGRLVPEKGLKYLINAFKGVKTDKKLVIAGGASDSSEFVDEIKALAEDDGRIIFTGFVEGRALHELYSNAYVYVLPSDLEGMPLSLLEAMSYGNCCLTSDIPECLEAVWNKAVSFRRSDEDDLREKLQRLEDNPDEVASYKAGAADFICGRFDWEHVVDRTLEIYYDHKKGRGK